jgi:hypothetical protein
MRKSVNVTIFTINKRSALTNFPFEEDDDLIEFTNFQLKRKQDIQNVSILKELKFLNINNMGKQSIRESNLVCNKSEEENNNLSLRENHFFRSCGK